MLGVPNAFLPILSVFLELYGEFAMYNKAAHISSVQLTCVHAHL